MMKAVTIHDLNERCLAFDLIDILRLSEPEVAASYWRISDVECLGDSAQELEGYSNASQVISGIELLRLSANVYQVIDGAFKAYRPDAERPWLIVRAVDSTLYVVVTNDELLLDRVQSHFSDVRSSPDDVCDY